MLTIPRKKGDGTQSYSCCAGEGAEGDVQGKGDVHKIISLFEGHKMGEKKIEKKNSLNGISDTYTSMLDTRKL